MMKNLFLSLILFGFAAIVDAAVHTVTLDSDDATTPVEGSLRYYVKNASKGDTIVFAVAQVTLEESLSISYKGLTLDGGTQGVVIDGNRAGRVLSVSYDSYNKIVLKNLTIQNGYLEDPSMAMGGGLYVFGTGDNENLLVENCTFRNNEVACEGDGQGGALRARGGIYMNCKFLDNTISGSGYSNTGGGAMAVGATFVNCLFVGNTAKNGGALYATNGTQVINCTITQNATNNGGEGAGLSLESESSCDNSILYNNLSGSTQDNLDVVSGAVSHCALEQGNTLVGSNTNIGLSASPFADAPNGDFSLPEGSPCINSGNSGLPEIPTHDLAGNNRISDGNIDLGAYELIVPQLFTGTVRYDDGRPIANYTIHDEITTDENGQFSLLLSEDLINETVFVLNDAPDGYTFYPGEFVFDDTRSIQLTAYAGRMVVQDFESDSNTAWETGIVNVFTTLNLNNSTLSIAPGTRVKFHGHYGIRITGTGRLLATGTHDAPIVFTSGNSEDFELRTRTTQGSWNKISFSEMSETADSSRLEFCVLEYSKEILNYGMGGVLEIDGFDKLGLNNCLFRNNSVVSSMMGVENAPVYINYSAINIVNSIFTDNYNGENDYVGAIYVDRTDYSDIVRIINCNITNNAATVGGAGVGVNDINGSDNVYLYNSIVSGNKKQSSFSTQLIGNDINIINSYVQGASAAMFPNSSHLYSAGVLFEAEVSMSSPYLAGNSVCINSGTLEEIQAFLPKTDLLGQPRIHQGGIDIGALEFQQDIVSAISGTVLDEEGHPLSNYAVYPGISTNENGEYIIISGQNNINNGDVLTLQSSDDRYFYPQKIVVGDHQIRSADLTVYKHKVVDDFSVFDKQTTWSDTINVMCPVAINNFEFHITPGTVLRFFNNSQLKVSNVGRIVANGTESDSIIFTSGNTEGFDRFNTSGAGAWSGISFTDMSSSAPKSTFNYCKIEYAKNIHEHAAITISYFNNIEFSNCLFQHNSGMLGGLFYAFKSKFKVRNSMLTKNGLIRSNVRFAGAAFYINASTVEILGCEISNNYSYLSSSAIYATNSNVNLINSHVVNNRTGATLAPGVQINLGQGARLMAYNSVLWGAANDRSTAQLSLGYQAQASIYNSCLQYGNSFNATAYDNSTDADPLFVDAASRNYQLQGSSPLVNAGLNTIPTTYRMQTDLLSQPRTMGGQVDIGAYEFNQTSLLIKAPFEYGVGEPVYVEGLVHLGEGSNWSWDFNQDGMEDANEASTSYTYDATGTYQIQLRAQLAGEATQTVVTHTIEISDTYTALPTKEQSQIKAYPNPAGPILWIEADQVYNISVCTLGGQSVWQGSMMDVRHSINTSAWPAGIYFIRLYNSEKSIVHKVVKE